jgi:hypothetical protein
VKTHAVLLLAGILLLATGPAMPAGDPGWQPSLDLRYRLEHVDDDSFSRDATASTLRVRLGLTSPQWAGVSAGVMGHGTRSLGTARYNSTANGRTGFPVVADPSDEGLSQAWLRFRAGDTFETTAGRQRLVEDNHRFLGNVGFRQLEQTFDAVSLDWRPDGASRIELRWLDRAHRVFGPSHPDPLQAEADLDAWLLTLTRRFGQTTVAAYGHRLVFEDRPASHRNLGLRVTGSLPGDRGLNWRAEFARQTGLRELSDTATQTYLHLRLGQQRAGWQWFTGHERLGGDGVRALQTPLATLHAHNGWTDRFLVTPADGLRDTYAGLGSGHGPWQFQLRAHDFRSDRDSRRYGAEYAGAVSRTLPVGLSLELKGARFDGRAGTGDIDKLWLTLAGAW